MTRKEFIKSVIRSRERLMLHSKSKKNYLQCAEIIKRLKVQIDTYEKKWTSEGWRNFLARNKEDIKFIMVGNKSYESKLETLNALINE
jgi:hypothetical protein